MLENTINWFLKPYPFVTTTKQKLLMSLVFGKIVFLFLYIFKPFGISKLDINLVSYTLGFGVITFLITLFSLFIFPLIFPKYFDQNKWIIGKMSLFFLGTTLLIGIANWYYNLQIVKPNNLLNNGLLHYILVTVLVSFFPLLFYMYMSEKNRSKQHTLVANKLSKTTKDDIKERKKIVLFAENKKDGLSLMINEIVYISSEGNYASIFYILKGELKEHLIRISLNELEKQLQSFDFIVRCHKSYIINTQQVLKIEGNARGYFLKLHKLDFFIPVSRSFPKEFLFTLVK
jgi:hypothetical protein